MSEMFAFGPQSGVLVIGLGRSGLASLEVLRDYGVQLYATDDHPEKIAAAIAAAQDFGARFVAPDEIDSIVPALTCAVLSPGVPPTSPVVRRVHAFDLPVIGEIELAYRLCKAPIVAVTGTKGKSTTTALIGHLLRGCGLAVRVGGNIGNPLIKEVRDMDAGGWIVAEVSSFQLETIRSFKPRVAVLLNIVPDHLDRYHSMEEYGEAKYRIFANQSMSDWFVGNLDDPRIRSLHWQRGTRVQARQLWYSLNHREHATMHVRDARLIYAPVSGDPRPVAIMSRNDIPLPGDHNVQNAMAAVLAGIAVGCDVAALREAMRTFRPMPHRLESVAEIEGVLYVDDSKATNPASVIAALRSFDRPIVLIAGGRSKRSTFRAMGAAMRRRVKALVAIGEAGPEIARAAPDVESVEAYSMEEAVHRARSIASPGDVVLLSPGCASFDMFASAEERGQRFAAVLAELAEPAGA